MTVLPMTVFKPLFRQPRFALAGLAVLLLALAGRAGAEPTFAFDATPGKLPKTVVPLHYALDLTPDLDKLTFAGAETIDINVTAPTDRLVLNAVDLAVTRAAIGDDPTPAQIALDAGEETVTLTFAREIAPGWHQLSLAFTGRINRFARGLFMVDYPTAEGGARKRMISTQLEPTDARRIFPGWDEPAFKASFTLTVTVPQAFMAVSNTPVEREVGAGAGAGDGMKRVVFQSTPQMSSYLFVLTAGELERTTTEAAGVTIGVVTTKGKGAQARYALDSAAELLRYYNAYFGVRYPLPKLDLIAVPGGFGGAMENWGGITFFESRLLFDSAKNSDESKRGIFSIIAHEMAHQWFGDLVTMAWWDNLWLNEGFASWMQAKAAEYLHADWQTWLNSVGAKQGAMAEDARRTSHPIQRPIANESEADVAFDGITYNKGQAFIRMLEGYLGERTFAAGIQAYMRQHAYSSATTADLWKALAAASGKPVEAIASAYTEQAGVPLVVAQVSCTGDSQRITLRQDRFTIHDPDPKAQHWQVPVVLGTVRAGTGEKLLLDGSAEIALGRCGEAVKVNLGDVGYFRVQYDGAMAATLAGSIGEMLPADRVNLLADTWALVEASRARPAVFFDLVERLGGDDSRLVWDQVMRAFSRVDHLEWGRPGRDAFHAYARALLRPVFDRLGFDAVAGETQDRAILRPRLISMLGSFGDEAILAEANRRFAAYLKDPASLRPDLRGTVTHLVGVNADRATYDTLLGLARKTTDTNERVRYYAAAASALDPALAQETLAIALTDELPSTLVGTLISTVASSGEHRYLAWAFVKANFSALAQKQGPSFRNTFASNLMTNFTDAAHATELASFEPVHETSGGRRVAERSEERIMTDADFAVRQLPAVDEWVKRRPVVQP
jgi:aminopeptidase N